MLPGTPMRPMTCLFPSPCAAAYRRRPGRRAPWGLPPPLVVFALQVAVVAAGCGARQRGGPPPPPPQPPTEQVALEGMQIVAERHGDGFRVSHRDPDSLFKAAAEAFEAQDFERAIELYGVLLQEFPTSRFVTASRYNLGLSLEEVRRFADAQAHYERIIAEGGASQDALDARFRLSHCLREQDQHVAAATVLRALLDEPALGRNDRVLAQLLLGEVLLSAGSLDESEAVFQRVLGHSRLKGRPGPLPLSDRLLARARYGLARVSHERFRSIAIRLPQEQMEKDINDKARTFLRAQAQYLRTIRLRIAELVTAAGLQIGTLYEEFYQGLVEAPVPPELTSEEVEVYFEELLKVIRPLVEQAIHVYERNLLYAERFGVGNEWVQETEDRLERLRRFLEGAKEVQPGTVPPSATPEPFCGPPEPPSGPSEPPGGPSEPPGGPSEPTAAPSRSAAAPPAPAKGRRP